MTSNNGNGPTLNLEQQDRLQAATGIHPKIDQAIRELYQSLLNPADSSSNNGPKTTWTVSELMQTEFTEPNWAVPGIIPAGLTILGGKPKLGKSWLLLQIAQAKSTGGKFAGVKLDKAKVLFLALEDSPRRLKDRLIKQKAPKDADICFVTEWKVLSDGGLIDLQNQVITNGYQLVIIDTLSRFIGGRVDQKDPGEVTDALGALQHFAITQNIAIVIIDHHRKSNGLEDGDPIEDVLGSISKGGVVDCGIGLYRKRGKHEATMKLTGREVAERELSFEWDGALFCWQYLGEANQVREDTDKGRVYTTALALYDAGQIPTTSNISDALKMDVGNVSHYLADLVADGLLVKSDKVGRQQPYVPVTGGSNEYTQ